MKTSLTRDEVRDILRNAFYTDAQEVLNVRIMPTGDYLAEIITKAREDDPQEKPVREDDEPG